VKNLNISTKLIVGFLLVALIAGIVGAVGLFNIRSLNDSEELLYEENMLGVVYSGDANIYYQRLRYNMAEMIILKDGTKTGEYVEKLNSFIVGIDDNLKDYEDGIITETDRNQFAPVQADWNQYKAYMQQVIQLAEKGQYDQAKKMFLEDADEITDSLIEGFLSLYEYNTEGAEVRFAANAGRAKTAILIMNISIFAAVGVAVALGLFISRSISKPLKIMVEAANSLAGGNFEISVKADSKDETGMLAKSFINMASTLKELIADLNFALGAFAEGNFAVESQAQKSYIGDFAPLLSSINKLKENLTNTLMRINSAAEQVAAGSNQVSDGAQALAAGSTEQASSVEELTVSIGKIAEQAEDSLKNVVTTNQDVEQAGRDVNAGNERMAELSKAMAEIGATSNQIANITKVIEDIAFQTNILALNAAIEASRAGSAGKGFAVVADEVRSLAAKSAEAAKQTAELIRNSVEAVAKGNQLSNETVKLLEDVGKSAMRVIEGVAKIGQASAEQSHAIEQIKQGLDQVSAVIQTNAATAEENSATSEEMAAQAVTLREEVGKFKLSAREARSSVHAALEPERAKLSSPELGAFNGFGKY